MRQPLKDGDGLPKWLIFVMAAITALTLSNCYYIQPLLGSVAQDIGTSQFNANIIVTMLQAGYGLGLFFIVPLGDLISARKMTTANFAVLIVVMALMAFADNVQMLWLYAVFIGACSVMPQIYIPFTARYSNTENCPKNISIIVSGLLVGILGSRIISGFIGEHWGWRTVFIMGSGIMVLCFVVNLMILPRQEMSGYKGTYGGLLLSIFSYLKKYPYVIVAAIRAACVQGAFFALWAPLTFKLREAPFFAGDDVIGLMGIFGIAGAISVVFVGRYINILGAKKVSMIGALLAIAGWLSTWFGQDSYLGIIIGILLLDIGTQGTHLANQSSVVALEPAAINRLNTIYMTIFFIIAPFGTFLAGWGWSNYGWAGVVVTGVGFGVASLLMNPFDRRKRTGSQAQASSE